MSRYLLSPEAKQDLKDIKTYLVGEGGAPLARYVLGAIREGIRFVARYPGSGHLREDLTTLPVKFWHVFSYLIIYDPSKRPIEVARVLHGRRDVETILKT
jgi:antitoxin ParD1/3/4/toxin ParE1/3/4